MSPPYPRFLSRPGAVGQTLAVVVVICAPLGVKLWRSGGTWSLSEQWLPSSLLLGVFMLLVVALFSTRDPGRRASLGFGRSSIGATVGWGLLSVAAVYVASVGFAVLCLVLRVDTHDSVQKKIDWALKFAAVPWPAVPPLVAFVAFWEETVFRGFLLGRVRATLSANGEPATQLQRDIAAVVFTALLFGLCHGYQGVMGIAQTSFIGLVFGGLTLWRKSIWPAVFAHFTIDGVAFSIAKLGAPYMLDWLRNQSTS
jgi:membrane protease YdiL (CAAX protease family)